MKGKHASSIARDVQIVAHLTGEVVRLEQVNDEVFAQKILGDGIAVLPQAGELYAPAEARVEQVFDSHHALTLVTIDGVELLLHVGIDTVQLKGQHFDVKVKEGQSVKRGELLMTFDIEAIRQAGYDVTTPLIVSNSGEFDLRSTEKTEVVAGEDLLYLTRKE